MNFDTAPNFPPLNIEDVVKEVAEHPGLTPIEYFARLGGRGFETALRKAITRGVIRQSIDPNNSGRIVLNTAIASTKQEKP